MVILVKEHLGIQKMIIMDIIINGEITMDFQPKQQLELIDQ